MFLQRKGGYLSKPNIVGHWPRKIGRRSARIDRNCKYQHYTRHILLLALKCVYCAHHIVIPGQLAQEIDAVVGKRGRSSFLMAAMHELSRLRQLHAIENIAGFWKDKDHPEFKEGAVKWVAKQRQLDERRASKLPDR